MLAETKRKGREETEEGERRGRRKWDGEISEWMKLEAKRAPDLLELIKLPYRQMTLRVSCPSLPVNSEKVSPDTTV